MRHVVCQDVALRKWQCVHRWCPTQAQCKESFSWNGIAAAPPLRRGRSNEEVAEIQGYSDKQDTCCTTMLCVLNDATMQNSDKVRRAYHYERYVMMYVYISFAEP